MSQLAPAIARPPVPRSGAGPKDYNRVLCETKGCSGHPLADGLCVACHARGRTIQPDLIAILKADPHRTGKHPDIRTTRQMYQRYQDGLSLAQIAQEFEVTRQTVYDRFRRRGGILPLRSRILQEGITYQGRKYTPDKNGYYRRTIRRRKTGRTYRRHELHLHHEIWVEHRGPIPEGHQVGFRDGDKGNVSIDNLICLPLIEMARLKHQPHPTPVKYCEHCGRQLVRRVNPNGSRESPSALKCRRFCNLQCKGAFFKGKSRCSTAKD